MIYKDIILMTVFMLTCVHLEDFQEVVVILADRAVMICEPDMLCRNRCASNRLPIKDDKRISSRLARHAHRAAHVLHSINTEYRQTTESFTNNFYNVKLKREFQNSKEFRLSKNIDEIIKPQVPWTSTVSQYQNKSVNAKKYESVRRTKREHNNNNNNSEKFDQHCSKQFPSNVTCFCDQVCVIYGDCCADSFIECFHLNRTHDIIRFISDVWTFYFASQSLEYTDQTSLLTEGYTDQTSLLTEGYTDQTSLLREGYTDQTSLLTEGYTDQTSLLTEGYTDQTSLLTEGYTDQTSLLTEGYTDQTSLLTEGYTDQTSLLTEGYTDQTSLLTEGYTDQTSLLTEGYTDQTSLLTEGYTDQTSLLTEGYTDQTSLLTEGYTDQTSLLTEGYTDQTSLLREGYTDQTSLLTEGYTDQTSLLTEGYTDQTSLLREGYTDQTSLLTEGYTDQTSLLREGYTDQTSLLTEGYTDQTSLLTEGYTDQTSLLTEGYTDQTSLLTEGYTDQTSLLTEVYTDQTSLLAEGYTDQTSLLAEGYTDQTSLLTEGYTDQTSLLTEGYTDQTSLLTEGSSVLKIIKEMASCEKISKTTSMLLVNRCPGTNVDRLSMDTCQNAISLEHPPVSVTLPDGDLTFSNKLCALCHGVSIADMKVWSSRFLCDKNMTTSSIENLRLSELLEHVRLGRCNISYSPPADVCVPRQCDPESSLTEHQKYILASNTRTLQCTPTDIILCRTYYYPSKGYKNTHCNKCLHFMTRRRREESSGPQCDVAFRIKHQQKLAEQAMKGGVLIILDITGAYRNEKITSSYICEDIEVFDPMTLKCMPLVCVHNTRPYRGQCVKSSNTLFIDRQTQIFPNGWDSLILRMISNTDSKMSCHVLINVTFDISRFYWNKSLIESDRPDPDMYFISNSCDHLKKSHETEIVKIVNILLARIFQPGLDVVDELSSLNHEITMLSFFNGSYEIIVSNKVNLTSTLYTCSNGNTSYQLQHFSIVNNNNTYYVVSNASKPNVYYPFRNIVFEITFKYSVTFHTLTQSQTAFVCDADWLPFGPNCTIVKYLVNETSQNGSTLLVLESGQIYKGGDFQISGDYVFVCSSFRFESMAASKKQNMTYFILSLSLTSISIIFLLIMLIIYWLIPELQTLPMSMTSSLAATMLLTFLSNVFTLFDLKHKYICPFVAALGHVVTLAHFGWMSAISVNMALTFSPLAKPLIRPLNDRTLFLRYNMVVWGLSLAIVTPSVILDLNEPELNSNTETTASRNYPRYGYPDCTWFSGPIWTKLVFIVIPYLITFIIGLVGFILTLVGIHITSKSSEKLGNKFSEKARCIIYLKLSSAMGFSWIISIVVGFYPSDILLYIYLCLVLIQGLLLFLSFMLNHRVYYLIKKRFVKRYGTFSGRAPSQSSIVKQSSTCSSL